jgi:glutamate--cysteine ligase
LYQLLQQRLKRLQDAGQAALLIGGLKGVEKESLRVSRDGEIAQTPHPPGLGSALTHPNITTDYSEALLELRTPPFATIGETLEFLAQLHSFVYTRINGELLWGTSMPCALDGDSSIPIAWYGRSNVGTMKLVYRRGLAYRYGRAMQAIAGVHFNYSMAAAFWPAFQAIENNAQPVQDFISESYFCLIRNFQRLGWLIPYLFGASPAVCKSFLQDERPAGFAYYEPGTYYKPYATSLRMSDIGYKNNTQANLKITYDNLAGYVNSLTHAIETSYPGYEEIGIFVDGEYRQLNTNILQIENEYYSFIRPKQIARSGEKPTLALKRRGVQYVEIRALDVDVFEPLGVSEGQLRFLEVFLVFCLLQESPPISAVEQKEFEYNQRMVADYGRDPSLTLQRRGGQQSLREWATEICNVMRPIAEIFDRGERRHPYVSALKGQLEIIGEPERTPSARVLAEMWKSKESFSHFGLRMSLQHERHFKQHPLPAEQMQRFIAIAEGSLKKQQQIENADEISFEEYLRRYFAES